MKPLLIVVYDLGSAGPAEIIASARDVCEIAFVCDPGRPHVERNLGVLRSTAPVIEITDDPASIVAGIKSLRPEGITTFSEFQIVATAHAAAALGLLFHDRTVAAAVTDKARQRALLAAAGLPTATQRLISSVNDVETAAAAVGFPAVLKPRHGAGSRDTFLVTGPDELNDALANAREQSRRDGLVLEQLLVGDPSVAGTAWGDYVSVESVVLDGVPRHVCTTGKFPLARPFRERGQFVPSTLAADVSAEVHLLVSAALEALSVRDGVTHTEVKLTPEGPRILEVNGRVGGQVAGLLRRAGDYDLLAAAMRIAVGAPVAEGPRTFQGVAFRHYLAASDSPVVLSELQGTDEITLLRGVEHVTVRAQPGELLDPRNGTQECLGVVEGTVEDHDELRSLIHEIGDRVTVRYDSAQQPNATWCSVNIGDDFARTVPDGGPAEAAVFAAFLAVLRKYWGDNEIAIDLFEPARQVRGVMSASTTRGTHVALTASLLRAETAAAAEVAQRTPARFAFTTGDPVTDTAHDFRLCATAGASEWTLRLTTRSPAFDQTAAERLLRHVVMALHQIVDDPDATLASIDLLSAAERVTVSEDFNATGRDYPRESTIDEVFIAQVTARPLAVALVRDDTTLTYQQLHERADALAERLRACGVCRGDHVALRFDKVPELVVAMLAILRAGAAYVPLDPRLPAERQDFLLRDSGSVAIVDDSGITAVDTMGTPTNAGATEHTAYVMYTSGTTGNPKGVLVPQRAVLRLVCGSEFARLGPDTRILQTGAIGFDATTFEIWGALLRGGTLVLVPDEVILDAPALGRAITLHAVTTMWLTAPLFHQLVDDDAAIFRPLREVLVGGDVLSPRHIAAVLRTCSGLRIINGYGPTENTTFSTTHLITEPPHGPIPIGRPITNSTAYVVDLDDGLSPIGVVGELLVGGDGLSSGYLTSDGHDGSPVPFTDDLFGAGKRLYRTGDLARWRPDGVLEFFGRRDRQLKIRGFRVEPDEVERHLAELPGVREAVVVVARRPDGVERYLRGFLTADRDLNLAGCRASLAVLLPGYMVPAELTQIESMPLNRNGKIDRDALPSIAAERSPMTRHRTSDPLVRVLARLWNETLGSGTVGPHDNIFDLGVTSLTAAAFAARARAELGPSLTASVVLANPTIAALAAVLRAGAAEISAVPELVATPRRAIYPVTWQQRGVYVEQLKCPADTPYNVPLTITTSMPVDLFRLEAAVTALVRRNENLRTTFHPTGNTIVQRVHDELPVKVEELPGRDERALRSFIRPFDLASGPLLRVGAHLARESSLIMLDLHHIVADGITVRLLLEELDALYAGATPADADVRYRDYAIWQAQHGEEHIERRQGPFWLGVHAGSRAPADLPTDFPRPAMRSVAGARYTFSLGEARCAALEELGRKHDGTPFHAVLCAYLLLLVRITGENDVAVGVPAAGRTLPGTDRLAGMIANTLCLRARIDPEWSVDDLLGHVRHHMLDAMDRQDYPFERLAGAVAEDMDRRRNPLFDTMLGFHPDGPGASLPAFGGVVTPADTANRCTMFDLNLQIHQRRSNWEAVWAYSTALFREETVKAFAEHFCALIDAITGTTRTIGDLIGHVADPAIAENVVEPIEFDFSPPAMSGTTRTGRNT